MLRSDRQLSNDESSLVAARRRGDEAVFMRLVDDYTPGMRRFALRFVRTPALADDVVQEAWLGVLRGLDRFEGRSSLKTWIYRIVANVARTRAVREARSMPVDFAEPSVDPGRFVADGHWAAPIEPWHDVLAAELRGVVDDAIALLPEQQRLVIQLRDVEGWGADEVCNVLSCPRRISGCCCIVPGRRCGWQWRSTSVWRRRQGLTCQELVELVTDYLEGELTRSDRARFELHIAACANCREYLAQFRQTMELTGALREDDVDPAARDALLAQFSEWRNASDAP